MIQPDLFSRMSLPPVHYPDAPGYRDTDTSRAAAEGVAPTAKTIRIKALAAIRAAGRRGLTAEELAAVLGVERVTAQPRTSELRLTGDIVDSGDRRPNASSGKAAIVWVAA